VEDFKANVHPTGTLFCFVAKTREQIQSSKKELLGAPQTEYKGVSLWNSLDNDACLEESLVGFKSSVQELGF